LKQISAWFLIYIISICLSCTTRDGYIIGAAREYGRLQIICNIDSAQIYIDEQPSGRFTSTEKPVLVDSLAVGSHTVQIAKECYRSDPPYITVSIQAERQTDVTFDLTLSESVGDLIILTEPDSALILFDGIAEGYSPRRLPCRGAGDHLLELRKGSYKREILSVSVTGGKIDTIRKILNLQRTVLIEHFSSSTCVPCVTADKILETVLLETGFERITSLGYHTFFPAPGDPMYLEAKDTNDARIEFYRLPTNPAMYIDGVISEIATFDLESMLKNAIEIRNIKAPAARLEIFGFVKKPGAITGRVRIEALANLSDITLRIALIEKEIKYPEAPGSNGQIRFIDVLRDFCPDAQGIAVTLMPGERRFVDFTFPTGDNWQLDELEVIAFLQETASKEVLQAVCTLYP
jgi:hypothetical protein